MSDADYAQFLAKEYGVTDPDEIAAIERQIAADCARNDELRAMAEGRA